MRRGRVLIYLAFILILALVAVLVVWTRIIVPSRQKANQVAAQASPTPVPVEVVLVSQNIPQGYILDEKVLTVVPWPADKIAPGMFKNDQLGQLYGRQVKFDLQAGTPLLDTMLLKQGEQIPMSGSPWALSIPSGYVAVSIPISRLSSVSYAPRPGDHVNVIASLMFVDLDTDFQSLTPNNTGVVIASGPPDPETKEHNPLTLSISPAVNGRTVIDPVLGQAIYMVPSEPQRPRMVTHMLLQDVIVLQMGNFPIEGQTLEQAQPTGPTPTPAAEGQPAAAPAPVQPDIITLVVRPQDAVTLNYIMLAQSQTAAQLSLVLRGTNDTSRENTLPVTLQFLLEQYQIPVPARLPYTLNPRIDKLAPPGLLNVAPTPVP
jgi:Flp pilus assembly protein CpaB